VNVGASCKRLIADVKRDSAAEQHQFSASHRIIEITQTELRNNLSGTAVRQDPECRTTRDNCVAPGPSLIPSQCNPVNATCAPVAGRAHGQTAQQAPDSHRSHCFGERTRHWLLLQAPASGICNSVRVHLILGLEVFGGDACWLPTVHLVRCRYPPCWAIREAG
jgi:hypothetical protein